MKQNLEEFLKRLFYFIFGGAGLITSVFEKTQWI